MSRAAIYARYSSDKQSESSLDDQFALCERRAQADGFAVIFRWGDHAVSGTVPIKQRSQGRLLDQAACSGKFDVLIVESLDRLSRDSAEQETFLRRLEHDGRLVIGVSDGYDSRSESRRLNRSIRGILNAQYLEDLSKKTHRGLTGKVSRGMAAGGAAFGYCNVKESQGSEIAIDESSAEVVRRIFSDFAAGQSVRQIVYALNAEGVLSPRRKPWAVSAIYGSPKKGTGILNNECYIGKQLWNRSRWLKHPDTGKRERRVRPESEWIVVQRPDLRIIDDETWASVRIRIQGQSDSPSKGGRPARTLFGGQLRCPECGGAIIAVNVRSYGCGTRKDRGPTVCPNNALTRRKDVDDGLLAMVRSDVTSKAAMARFEHELRVMLQREVETSQSASRAKEYQGRLSELGQEIKRLVDAIIKVGASDEIAARLKQLENEKVALEALVRAQRAVPLDVERKVRDTMDDYDQVVATLGDALESDVELARQALSKLLGRITLIVDDGGSIWADLENKTAQTPGGAGLLASLSVVAGALWVMSPKTV